MGDLNRRLVKSFLMAILALVFSTPVLSPAFAFEPTEAASLTTSAEVSSNLFGYSVAEHGDTVVIGDYGDDDLGTHSGSAGFHSFQLKPHPVREFKEIWDSYMQKYSENVWDKRGSDEIPPLGKV